MLGFAHYLPLRTWVWRPTIGATALGALRATPLRCNARWQPRNILMGIVTVLPMRCGSGCTDGRCGRSVRMGGMDGWNGRVERTDGTDDGGRDKACLVSTVDTVLIRLIRSIRSVAHGCHNYGYPNGGFYDRYVRTVTVHGGVAPNAAYCAYRGEWTNAVANGMGGWGLANGRCNKKGRHAGLPLRTWVWRPTIGATALGALGHTICPKSPILPK